MSPAANRLLRSEGSPETPAVRMRSARLAFDRAGEDQIANLTPAKDLGCAAVGAGIAPMSLVARLTKEKMEIQIKFASPKKFLN
jgi:hypothetical protein